MVINENCTVEVGDVKINLPSVGYQNFLIAQSLAEEFGLETNYEAEQKLREALKRYNNEVYKKIKIDAEAGCIFITSNPKHGEHILEVAILINQLLIPPYHQVLNDEDVEKIRNILIHWKRPKPQKWKDGDVFSIPLSNGSYGYGQILWHKGKKSVTCAILKMNSENILLVEEIIQSIVVSVITTRSEDLDEGKWKIIGNVPLMIKEEMVPWEHSGKPGVGSKIYQELILVSLIEAFFAIKPWNFLNFKDSFMDTLLLPGINRPSNVIYLTKEQKRLNR
ncbi:Imm26 family immunity protein [Neobacillus drentensis]|jgi:hypothetical protein|uniref:Imm26 family immunity protein n=2 Tax=Neobacillus drentensis TaxID=220684 RepID=UPI000BF616A7|nr:hypothetical protein CN481_16370 [Bacillus sp. AFS006103]